MRVLYRMTVLLGLFSALPALLLSVSSAQEDDRGRREERSRDGDGDDEGDEAPPWRRGGGFGGPSGEFGGPGGGFPGGGFPGGGGPGGGFPGGGGPGGGFPGGGGPGGGFPGGGGPGGGFPGGGGPGGGGPGGGWGGPGGGWGGRGGGWGGRGGDNEGRGGRGDDGEGRRGRGGFGGFGGGGFGGFNPVDMFARQDRNGDGQISLDELDERSRGFMQRMAQNNGLSESGPWRIDELRSRIEERMGGNRGRDGDDEQGRNGGNRGGSDDKEAKKPLVPGFGALASLGDEPVILVPGFGIPEAKTSSGEPSRRSSSVAARPRAAAASSTSTSRSSGSAGSRAGGGSRNEERARTMVKSNDANNDGKLQPDEMSEMIAKPKDTNGDGAVTVEEIAAALDAIDKSKAGGNESTADRGGGSGERARGARGPRGGSSSIEDGERKSFRFLTPKERLPKGIPDWFVDADEDGDGQVLMAEYSDRFTESKAKEFARRDLDGDGVITPREAASEGRSRDE